MLNRILYYYKKEIKLLTYFLVSSFIVTGLDLFGPVLVQRLIDDVIPTKALNVFFSYSVVLLIIYIGRLLLSLYSSSRGQLMGNKIKSRMRDDLFEKIMNQPTKFFNDRQSGDIISRVTNDLENTSALLYRGLEDFLFSILSIIGALILMTRFNIKLTIFTMIPLPFAIYFTIYQNKKLKKGYVNIRKNMSKMTSRVHNTLRVIFFVKDNNLEEEKLNKFKKTNEDLLEVEKGNIYNISALMSGVNFYNQLTQLIVIFVGGYLHIKGELSLGIIITFILLTNRFRVYLLRLMGLIDVFQRGITGIERFKEIIDLPQEEAGYKRLLKNVENIKFQDITFSYKGENLFENLSIFINKGEKVAFVGESGVGKTTLISLLKRNLSPILGKVLINNEILTNIKKEDYIDKIGVVDQNEHIINDTLIENMRIINREATDEDIEKALNLACLEDVVNKLENKKETLLGEGGVNLSSGQKQRIALARLFLKNPDVVFLDEATSALDNILENKIIKNINERFKDKIIISVAHRLNTLKEFDKIFVLGKKGIIEVGNFEQLLLNKGIFYKMYMGDEKA